MGNTTYDYDSNKSTSSSSNPNSESICGPDKQCYMNKFTEKLGCRSSGSWLWKKLPDEACEVIWGKNPSPEKQSDESVCCKVEPPGSSKTGYRWMTSKDKCAGINIASGTVQSKKCKGGGGNGGNGEDETRCPEGKKCFQQRGTGETTCAEPGSYSLNPLWFPKDSDKPCEQVCCKVMKTNGDVVRFDKRSRGKCNWTQEQTQFKTKIVDMANCEDGGGGGNGGGWFPDWLPDWSNPENWELPDWLSLKSLKYALLIGGGFLFFILIIAIAI